MIKSQGDVATQYRTESDSDRMLALNQRYHVFFASVESSDPVATALLY